MYQARCERHTPHATPVRADSPVKYRSEPLADCTTLALRYGQRSARASGWHDGRCGQYGSGPKPTSTQQSLMRTPVLSSTGASR